MPFRNVHRIAVCAAAILGACVSQPATVAPGEQVRTMAALRAGKLMLTCASRCRARWNGEIGAIAALHRAAHWSDLTLRIVEVGYGGDLAYFYLGQAAQGMGYNEAAITYYMQARALAESSDRSLQCTASDRPGDECQGIRIATAAPALAAVLQSDAGALAPQATPQPHRRPLATRRPGPRTAPAHSPGSLVAGLAQAMDTATLQVHGRTVPLAGLVGRQDAYAAELQALIDAHGTTVRCVRAGAGYTCTLPNGEDVAQAALASGIATVTADAPDALRARQQAARDAHRGIWRTSAGPTG